MEGNIFAYYFANNNLHYVLNTTNRWGRLGQDALEAAAAANKDEQSGYFCPDCNMSLDLSGIELLRHQRKHKQDKTTTDGNDD